MISLCILISGSFYWQIVPAIVSDKCECPSRQLIHILVAFLGNHFLQVLGEHFSAHSVSNPDQDSEQKLLSQLAPELSPELLGRLVAAFQDLRAGYVAGTLSYPYSLRGGSRDHKQQHCSEFFFQS